MSLSTTPNEITKVATSSTATSHCPVQTEESMPPPKPDPSRKRKKPNAPKTTQSKSWVWDHITKFTVKETREVVTEGKSTMVEVEVLKAKCNYCAQVFACDTSGGGTGTFGKHITNVCKKYKPNVDLKQKVLAGITNDGSSMLVARGFSQEESLKAIIEFLVIDEQPFNVVEKEGFRRMMSVIQPRLHVPSRRTAVSELLQSYHDMKEDLKGQLSKHRVNLTTDTWTSIQNVNYMVLTAHFVDDEWNMHKRILNFCIIPSHQGKQIGRLIEQCLVAWKIEKVMCISVDNASANKVALQYVLAKMKMKSNCSLILGGKYINVRCLAHIINLIVKEGLKKLDKSVASSRNAVKFVKSSPQRFAYFKKIVYVWEYSENSLQAKCVMAQGRMVSFDEPELPTSVQKTTIDLLQK